ncbi:MAG: AMP-binding protein [Candidatus Krumholzibacteriaceae bacterium]
MEDSAELYPEKNALFAFEKWHTFAELNDSANRLARLLVKRGLAKGDRVALFIENSKEYVATYYAVLKAGGITVALNTDSTADDVAYIIRDCGVRYLVTNEKLLRKIRALASGQSSGEVQAPVQTLEQVLVWSESGAVEIDGSCREIVPLPAAMEAEPARSPGIRMIDLDIASIVYTSGSTGKPRGAVLSHLNIVTNTRSIVDYLELTPDDRIMVVLPFYYIYGKSLLNTHFFVGGSVVVDNRFMYPNVILQTMKDQKVTGFSGVPSTFTILLGRSNVRSQKFETLRYVTQAGGAMAPAVQKQVAEVFAPARLFIMYGATEASARLSYLDPAELPRKWGSIGKAIPNVELFVADECGNPLPAGREGEIVARGSNLMSGYWNHPEETEKVLRNGLYYTGDIGRMDEEGFIFVVGRSKDMIKIGGNRVSAKEIEEALYEHPGIHEVAVIGIPDDVLGEAPKACIVLKSGYCGNIEEELGAFLKAHLALYKIPKCYEIRDSLPKNESGKIQKLKLK